MEVGGEREVGGGKWMDVWEVDGCLGCEVEVEGTARDGRVMDDPNGGEGKANDMLGGR